jgi:hypothetical protein
MSDCDDAYLSVIEAVIFMVEGLACEHLVGIGEVKAPLLKRGVSLWWVEGNPHGFM